MKQYIGPFIGLLFIAGLIANMVYLHTAIRRCVAQNAPGESHDWATIIHDMQK